MQLKASIEEDQTATTAVVESSDNNYGIVEIKQCQTQ